MITLDLTLPDTRYPIHIGHGLLDQIELRAHVELAKLEALDKRVA